MKSPFPGMDPYLEAYWGEVHHGLVMYGRDQLQRQLPPDLRASIEEDVTIESEPGNGVKRRLYPDVPIVEHSELVGGPPESLTGVAVAHPVVIPLESRPKRSVRIIEPGSGGRLITALEFLSPSNKREPVGRRAYQRKQEHIIDAGANLVEIDLVRVGSYVLAVPEEAVPAELLHPYRVSVVRCHGAFQAEVYRVSLREPLPTIRVPLRESDNDVFLNLQALIDLIYENGRLQFLDYAKDPKPPLEGDDAIWADALLREKGLRP